MTAQAHVPGTVYLLHLLEPYVPYPDAPPWSCAQHYTGWAGGGVRGLARRLDEHGGPHGSPLLAAARAAGITWVLAWTWPGTRELERKLKRQGGARRHCPLCGVTPRTGGLPRNLDGSISRLLTTDAQKAAAGLMTVGQLAEHTALRADAVRGQAPGIVRLAQIPADDPWYGAPPMAPTAAPGTVPPAIRPDPPRAPGVTRGRADRGGQPGASRPRLADGQARDRTKRDRPPARRVPSPPLTVSR